MDGTDPATAPGALEVPIAQRLGDIATLIRRSAKRAYPETIGITTIEGAVLRGIGTYRPTTAREIIGVTILNEGQVSITVRALSEKGLIERVPDTVDGRRKILTLTRRGEETLKKINRLLDTRQSRLLAGLTGAQQADFFRHLDIVWSNAQSMLSDEADAMARETPGRTAKKRK